MGGAPGSAHRAETADVVVVGGGIAGVSVAYELAKRARVVLVEAEDQLAHHTTGRSAAMYLPTYGSAVVRGLARASRAGFDELADRFELPPLLTHRGLLWIADEVTRLDLDHALAEDPHLERITPEEAVARCGCIRLEATVGAALDAGACEIDVMALHGGFVTGLRAEGGVVVRSHRVDGLAPEGDGWSVTAGDRRWSTPCVVDAAGAWADVVGALAGQDPIGLRPLRRTLFTSPVSWPEPIDRWPLVLDAAERFYFKPEHDQVLVSPADETPSEPCDAKPEPEDIAQGIDLLNERTTLGLRSVRTSWAGLRSFVADRTPVAGARPEAPGFFWLAGQGGVGIQTSSALARAAAGLVLDGEVPPDVAAEGVTAEALSPLRLPPGADLAPKAPVG